MEATWVVLVEAADSSAGGTIDASAVERLLEALEPGPYASALHSPDRYVLQVTTTALNPADALAGVLSRWADAVRQLQLPTWDVVRTEVLTPAELERDFQNARRDPISEVGPSGEPGHIGDDIGGELLRQAFSDPLTGLLSREAFDHQLRGALVRSGFQRRTAVVCLDLDAFGGVNARVGHATGDAVLLAVARRLGAMVRARDSLARLGSDEFAVVLECATEQAAVAVANRMLDALRDSFVVRGHELSLSASVGIALSEPGQAAEQLIRNATAALDMAAEAGGSRHVLYGEGMVPTTEPRLDVRAEGLQDRLSHLLVMQEAAVAANEADTLDQAARIVMRQICAHVGCAIGHLWLAPTDTSGQPQSTPLWHMADGSGYQDLVYATARLSSSEGCGLPGRVWSSRGPVWISDLSADARFDRREPALAAGLQSAFAFPVLVGREVVAALEFFARTRMEPTGSFLDVVSGVGAQLGRVVERQRAHAAVRRSAEQVRASEARLREAQALARLGSWHFDLRTGESNWSDEMCRLYGLDPGGPALDFEAAVASVIPADQARSQAALSRLVDSGEPTAEEVRIVRTDGEVRWHRAEGSVIRDENGLIVAIHGTSQDITEAKLAEEALREREAQLEEAQRVARLGSWEFDLATGRLRLSDELDRLFGRALGREPSVDAALATVHADDRERLMDEGAQLLRTGEPISLEFRALLGDGRPRWFRGGARLLHDEHGTPTKLFGTAQDITEQKRVEEELRASRELYRRIIETTNEGIVTIDSNHVTTFVNPRMAQILGYSVEEMTGMAASAFVDEETRAALSGHQRRRRAGMSEHYETELRANGGAAVHVLISASPLFDEEGGYAGTLAMVSDITVLRKAGEELGQQSGQPAGVVDEGQMDGEPAAS